MKWPGDMPLSGRLTPLLNAWQLRKALSAVHLRCSREVRVDVPTLYVATHSARWDGPVALLVNSRWLRQDAFLLLDEKQLRWFPWLGNQNAVQFSLESFREIRRALERAAGLLENRFSAVWTFAPPEIRHQDARPIRLLPGLGALMEKNEHLQVVPVSIYYTFVEDVLPEAFVSIGRPLLPASFDGGNRRMWAAVCEKELALLADELREKVIGRETGEFTTVWKRDMQVPDWAVEAVKRMKRLEEQIRNLGRGR